MDPCVGIVYLYRLFPKQPAAPLAAACVRARMRGWTRAQTARNVTLIGMRMSCNVTRQVLYIYARVMGRWPHMAYGLWVVPHGADGATSLQRSAALYTACHDPLSGSRAALTTS